MNAILSEEWHWTVKRAVLLVALATLPYLVAYLATPGDLFYTGFLSNPEDGHSYLAKMRQGQRGEWLFHLPYTPEPHEGEFLFTYYVALGHLARVLGAPLLLIYHLARIMNGFLLLLVLYYAAAHFFQDRDQRRFAFTLTAIGSGLGWIIALLGGMTADLWVPEGYVFYSLFANPHFPLAIALMLLLILWSAFPVEAAPARVRRMIALLLGSAALGIVQPFCLLSVGLVLLVHTLVLWIGKRRLPWCEVASMAAIGVAGLPFVANAYLASVRNPAFAAWSAQNQTPSPPLWDYALSYGVILLLALAGLKWALRRRRDSDWLLVAWTGCTIVLLYAPFSLQRRLVMGLVVPLGMLATAGWYGLVRRRHLRTWLLWPLAGMTHLFLVVVALVGALTHSGVLFLARDEHLALDWLAVHASPDDLVIAAPETGLYVPAWAGQHVLYGHRFETCNAEQRQAELVAFFQGELALPEPRPDYLLYGPREQRLSQDYWQPQPPWSRVYQQGSVTIYALPKE